MYHFTPAIQNVCGLGHAIVTRHNVAEPICETSCFAIFTPFGVCAFYHHHREPILNRTQLFFHGLHFSRKNCKQYIE